MLFGSVEAALLNNNDFREGFFRGHTKMQACRLKFPLTGYVKLPLLPGEEDQIILVESFAYLGCVGVGICLIMES